MAEALATAPAEFRPEQMTLSTELLQTLTDGDITRLEELLSSEGHSNDHVAINVQAAATAASGQGSTTSRWLLGVTSNGSTALHLVVSRGHTKLVALICERAPSLVATRNKCLDTPLHCAAKAGHLEATAGLLSTMRAGGEEEAVALRARNCLGATALYEAVRHRRAAVVDLLMEEAPELASVTTDEGISPLYLAASTDSLQIIRALLRPSQAGMPSPAAFSGPDGLTALHAAASGIIETAREMVQEILNWVPEGPTLLTKVDSSGRTPLHYAIRFQGFDIVDLFLDVPASDELARISDNHGLFPVHTAATVGSTSIIDKLIIKCPDYYEMTDDQGRNLLHCAVQHNQETVVRHICQNHAIPVLLNATDYDGNTPLHLAVKYGFPRIVFLLLQIMTVDIDITNKDGQTAGDLGFRGMERGRLYHPIDPVRIVHNCLCWSNARYAVSHDHFDDRSTGTKENTSSTDDMTKIGTIGSVLIATVAFAAAFTVPGGFIADDNPSAGTAILARRFAFRAFVVSDTMAFACAILATSFLILGGATEVPRNHRRFYYATAPVMVSIGAVFMITAFAFGFSLVLGNANHGLIIFIYMVCLATVSPFSVMWTNVDLGLVKAVWRRAGWRGIINIHESPSGMQELLYSFTRSLVCTSLLWPFFVVLITATFVVAITLNIALPNY